MPVDLEPIHHLHEWAKGRPILVAQIAHQMAAAVPIIVGLTGLIRSGTAARIAREQAGEVDWLPLYRDPARVRRVVQEAFWPEADPSVMAQFGRFLTNHRAPLVAIREKLDAAPPEAMEQVGRVLAVALRRGYVEHLAQVAAMVHDLDEGEVGPDVDMDEAMRLPEIRFFMLVMMPALMEYGRSPTWLYASARRGNRQSLDNLLRLDKTVMSEPGIAVHVQRFGMERDEFGAELVAKAYAGSPDTIQERVNVKARVANHIIRASRSLGYKLRPVDIRRLFDALKQDRRGDPNDIDTDIPDGEEAWRQAVHRAKPFWGIDLDRDRIGPLGRHGHLLMSAVVSDFDESDTRPISLPFLQRQAGAGEPARLGCVGRLREKLRQWLVRLVAYAQRR